MTGLRKRRRTIASSILGALALVASILVVMTGSAFFLGLAIILFIAAFASRKRESIDEYRERYDEEYGIEEGE